MFAIQALVTFAFLIQNSFSLENMVDPIETADSNSNYYRASVIPVDLLKYPEKSYRTYNDYGYDSHVHRSPYDSHNVYDAIRTRDREYKPYRNAYTSYKYDYYKVPDCAYSNNHYYNITFCLQDDHYPIGTIKYELEKNRGLVEKFLTDITYQSADNLVDGLSKIEEEGYTYEHYFGNKKYQTYSNNDHSGYTYSDDYYKDGGYICPSDIYYGRPKRAVNTYGHWKVIVNLLDEHYVGGYAKYHEKYTQTQRLEQCIYPSAPCSYIDHKYHSSCLQKFNFVRMLAYTYEEGLHIDAFKLPIACSCHVSKPNHYGYYIGVHH
nr:LOW QUALITY PROTEIN: uncharacterized protein LOC121123311 [Lepeophtheirus salmonis]